MIWPVSTTCWRYLSSLLLAPCFIVTLLGARPQARACMDADFDIALSTTFDPRVLDVPQDWHLFYELPSPGVGVPCEDCARREILADWAGFLGSSINMEDWSAVLFDADLPSLLEMSRQLTREPPVAWCSLADRSVLHPKKEVDRQRLADAVSLITFARAVELSTPREPRWDEEEPAPVVVSPEVLQQMQEQAEQNLATQQEPFLRQRYAFQLLRLRFYRGDWPGVIHFHEAHAAALAGPSESLRWRGRHYLAGALSHAGRRAEANLELTRIHFAFPALASPTITDFQPLEQTDWQQCLNLAANRREKTQLWQMVGLKADALGAMQEIIALDPSSPYIALLALRELARLERNYASLAPLARLAEQLAHGPQTDRPWLFDLIAGHLAALAGDLPETRLHTERALLTAPKTPRIAAQAHASVALALAKSYQPDTPALGDELCQHLDSLDPSYERTEAVTALVRDTLAASFKRAGRLTDAELLHPTAEPVDSLPHPESSIASTWRQPAFVQQLMVRITQNTTPFDRFIIGKGYSTPTLQRELALAHLVRGEIAAADKIFSTTEALSSRLQTDPFVIQIFNSDGCDYSRCAQARWTHKSFVKRLAQLETQARGTGQKAAEAAFALANGLYNMTYFGNARSVFFESHNATTNTALALKWYQRAFKLSKEREFKAKAAFMAAKCELNQLLVRDQDAPWDLLDKMESLPIPKKWFPVVRSFADTAYHREILAECGHYARWFNRSTSPP